MKLTYCFLLCLLIFSYEVKAKEYDTIGVGLYTCGQYAEKYKQNTSYADAVYMSWAWGFISGLNATRIEKHNLDEDGSQIFRSIRSECAKNPLKLFIDVVFDTYLTLPLIKQKP